MTTVPYRRKRSAAGLLQSILADKDNIALSAMIEIADRCNEVCVHCYQVQGQKGELETDDWRKILDELASMGVLFLVVSGGEATLRSDFLEIVEYARALKFAVKVYSNGIRIDEAMADALAALSVQEVQISLYSPRAEVHDWVTRVPGSWDKAVRATELLVERKVAVVLKTPLMSFNVDDRHEFIDLATRLGADYSLDPQLDAREDGDRGPQSFEMSEEHWWSVQRDPRIRGAFPARKKPERSLDRPPCGACSGNVHIEANGEMRPCSLLDVPVGHALRDGVRASWENNPAAREIRSLTWRDLHGCRDCDLQPYCGRCYANARREAGDALGPYASACRRAVLQYELITGVRPELQENDQLDRPADIGPFRLLEGGRLLPVEDVLTEDDVERSARLSWVRQEEVSEPLAPAHPGQLVQIRRPGSGGSKLESVPSRSGTSTVKATSEELGR